MKRMKRIVSVLMLVLLLMPAGRAENEGSTPVRYVLSWTASEEGILSYLENGGFEGEGLSNLASVASALMNALSMELICQENALYFGVRMQDREVLNLYHDATDGGLICSSLFPGVGLRFGDGDEARESLEQLPEEINWAQIANGVTESLGAFLQAHETQVESGRFVGDTYVDCDMCRIVNFDDRDIAEFLDEQMESLAPLKTLLEAYDMGELFAWLEDKNIEAARQNVYQYDVVIAYREGQVIGADFVVYRGEEPMMALSAGFPYEGDTRHTMGQTEILLTVPLYPWLVEHQVVFRAEQTENQWTLQISSNEYLTATWLSTEELEADQTNLLRRFVVKGTVDTQPDGNMSIRVEDQLTDPDYGIVQSRTDMNLDTDKETIEGEMKVYAGIKRKEAWGWKLTCTDGVMPEVPCETVIGIDEDSERWEEALSQGTSDLMIKLMQSLPAEVIMLFVQMGI